MKVFKQGNVIFYPDRDTNSFIAINSWLDRGVLPIYEKLKAATMWILVCKAT